jgi:hypothetical protein
VTSWAQDVIGPFEHVSRRDDVLEDVIHRNDVIPTGVSAQVGVLEGSLEHIVPPGTTLGGDVRLDLYAGAFDVEVTAEFVEVATVAGSNIEHATPTPLEKTAVESCSRARSQPHQQPSYAAVVLVVRVIVTWVEGRKLRFQGSWIQKL